MVIRFNVETHDYASLQRPCVYGIYEFPSGSSFAPTYDQLSPAQNVHPFL